MSALDFQGLFVDFFPFFYKKNLFQNNISIHVLQLSAMSCPLPFCLCLLVVWIWFLRWQLHFLEQKCWLLYRTLVHKVTGKSHAPITAFHHPSSRHTLNYPALVSFVSPKCPLLLIFKGVIYICVPLLRAPALYFQWKHSLTGNPGYLVVFLCCRAQHASLSELPSLSSVLSCTWFLQRATNAGKI